MNECPAHLNPFRASRIDALPYVPVDQSWDRMLTRLVQMNFRGAIVGPHGTGKTTLVQSLIPRLNERGFGVHHGHITEASPRLPKSWWCALNQCDEQTIIIIDGAERIHWWPWHRLLRLTANACGLLITAHEEGRLPTWIRTRVTTQVMLQLLNELEPHGMHDAAQLLARHHGNARSVLRECFGLKQRQRPA